MKPALSSRHEVLRSTMCVGALLCALLCLGCNMTLHAQTSAGGQAIYVEGKTTRLVYHYYDAPTKAEANYKSAKSSGRRMAG
jgi:hypothetical protein